VEVQRIAALFRSSGYQVKALLRELEEIMNKCTKHTPGPWKVIQTPHKRAPGESAVVSVADGHERTICYVCSVKDGPLISRLPDLLAENERLRAALTSAVLLLEDITAQSDQSRADYFSSWVRGHGPIAYGIAAARAALAEGEKS